MDADDKLLHRQILRYVRVEPQVAIKTNLLCGHISLRHQPEANLRHQMAIR